MQQTYRKKLFEFQVHRNSTCAAASEIAKSTQGPGCMNNLAVKMYLSVVNIHIYRMFKNDPKYRRWSFFFLSPSKWFNPEHNSNLFVPERIRTTWTLNLYANV